MKTIRIGTRGSHLALWQAQHLAALLESVGVTSELVIISTKGDVEQQLSFDKMEGKGFFTKEIEDALLRGEVDVAVHSMKDLPTTQPEGLVIAGVSYRENPAEWLLIRPEAVEEGQLLRLKQGAVVGTSSARRKAQLLDFRKDISLKDLRGNVPTRVEKLRRAEFDAVLLAAAGLTRLALDLAGLEIVPLSPREFVPAPAQGVLAFQCCADDKMTRRLLRQIHHPNVAAVTNVERKVLKLVGGGCHAPVGAYCERDSLGNYHVWAVQAGAWNEPLHRVRLSSTTSFNLAEKVAQAFKQTEPG